MQEKLMTPPGIDDNYVLINGERRKNRFPPNNGATQQHTDSWRKKSNSLAVGGLVEQQDPGVLLGPGASMKRSCCELLAIAR